MKWVSQENWRHDVWCRYLIFVPPKGAETGIFRTSTGLKCMRDRARAHDVNIEKLACMLSSCASAAAREEA